MKSKNTAKIQRKIRAGKATRKEIMDSIRESRRPFPLEANMGKGSCYFTDEIRNINGHTI